MTLKCRKRGRKIKRKKYPFPNPSGKICLYNLSGRKGKITQIVKCLRKKGNLVRCVSARGERFWRGKKRVMGAYPTHLSKRGRFSFAGEEGVISTLGRKKEATPARSKKGTVCVFPVEGGRGVSSFRGKRWEREEGGCSNVRSARRLSRPFSTRVGLGGKRKKKLQRTHIESKTLLPLVPTLEKVLHVAKTCITHIKKRSNRLLSIIIKKALPGIEAKRRGTLSGKVRTCPENRRETFGREGWRLILSTPEKSDSRKRHGPGHHKDKKERPFTKRREFLC